MQVDHVLPVIDPQEGFKSWDETVERMFCEKEGFQILCKSCHKSKSSEERQKAKERRIINARK